MLTVLYCMSSDDVDLVSPVLPDPHRRVPQFEIGDTLRRKDNPAEWLDILNLNDKGYYVATPDDTPKWVDLDYVEKDYELWHEKD